MWANARSGTAYCRSQGLAKSGGREIASIIKEIRIDADPELVWDAVSDFDGLDEKLLPGYVTECRPEGDRERTITFASGMVLGEALVGLDDEARRFAYTLVEGPVPFDHYGASVQVLADDGGSRVVWIADVLPEEFIGAIEEVMDGGLAVMKKTLEAAGARP